MSTTSVTPSSVSGDFSLGSSSSGGSGFSVPSTGSSGSSAPSMISPEIQGRLSGYMAKVRANAIGFLILGIFVAVQASFAINMYDQFVKCKYSGAKEKPPIGDVLNVTLMSIVLVAALVVICMSIYVLTPAGVKRRVSGLTDSVINAAKRKAV